MAPVSAEAAPAGHGVQPTDPSPLAKLPALQYTHDMAPADEYWPAKQPKQINDAVAPTVRAEVPAGQLVHCAFPVVAAYVPGPQLPQLAVAAAAKVPAAQSTQSEESAARGVLEAVPAGHAVQTWEAAAPSTAEKRPRAHPRQLVNAVAATAVEKVPAAQREQLTANFAVA